MTATTVGLRVDVDTLRGTRHGVPTLLEILRKRQIHAGFFFSVGPDNMGRHLRRLLRPRFLLKMLRSDAPGLYGWDILLKGTLWPGPLIGSRCAEVIRATAEAGHEVGLHAWDHHGWQAGIERFSEAEVEAPVARGCEEIARITGRPPDCFAAPGWRVSAAALAALEKFPFRYRSDCRGDSPFLPLPATGSASSTPQLPNTLPTYDELVGSGCRRADCNRILLEDIRPGGFNLLTIHAEAEGGVCAAMFAEFLAVAAGRNISFVPPGRLLAEVDRSGEELPLCPIERGRVAGREGFVSVQGAARSG